MRNMKKAVALALAATMVLGSSLTAFAEEPTTSGGSNGTGASEGHVDTHVIDVTLPTIASGSTPFAYTMDPERLIQATEGGKYADGTVFPTAENDTGVYFLTGVSEGGYSVVSGLTVATAGSDVSSYKVVKEGETVDATDLADENSSKLEDATGTAQAGVTYYEWKAADGEWKAVTGLTVAAEGDDVSSYYTVKSGVSDPSLALDSEDFEAASGKAQSGVTYYRKAAAGTKTYANSSEVLTATSESSADVLLTVEIELESAATDITLSDAALTGEETDAKLYLALTVGGTEGGVTGGKTEVVKKDEKVSIPVTIKGVDENFDYVVKTDDQGNKSYDYDVTATDPEWNAATIQMAGAVSNASAEGLTAPTLKVTWKYEDPDATVDTYDVTFNTNGGSEVEKQTVDAGEKATEPATDPTKDADEDYTYTFAGWYADEELTEEFDFDTAINAATVIYAKWDKTEIVADAAPSIATTSIAYTSGQALEIPVSLGAGDLAATGINRITYVNSSQVSTALATANWSFADGKITIAESYITALAGSSVTRDYKVTFDDAATTQVTITLHP